jgi:hypothetical protein
VASDTRGAAAEQIRQRKVSTTRDWAGSLATQARTQIDNTSEHFRLQQGWPLGCTRDRAVDRQMAEGAINSSANVR